MKTISEILSCIKKNPDTPLVNRQHCHDWTRGCDTDKYGKVKWKGKTQGVSRLLFEYFYGPITLGICVCHLCDRPICCNKMHFFLGTNQDNADDMVMKNRSAKGDRHGSHTHPERLTRGDLHWSRVHPERLTRGDLHWSRVHPEKLARGDRSGARTHPERLARGDQHGSHTHPEKWARGDQHYSSVHPEKVLRGEQAGNAKLNWHKVDKIRNWSKKGRSQRWIAKRFGCSRQNVGMILNNKTWKKQA